MKVPTAKEIKKRNERALKATKRAQNPVYKAMHRLPYVLGIFLAVLILLLSVLVGNARTLNNVAKQAEKTLQIDTLVKGRLGEAANLLKIASRYEAVSAQSKDALSAACDVLRTAKGVHNVSMANLSLQDAMFLLEEAINNTPAVTGEDKQLVVRVMDNFASLGNQIRQAGRSYNRQAQHAIDVYRGLPARILLPAPELFEGVTE